MEAHLYLFELLEKTNDVEGLLAALDVAKPKSNRETADFLFYNALAYFRKDSYEKALKLLSQIAENDISDIRKAKYYKLKGDLLQHDRNYGAAFIAYEASNDAVKASSEYQRQKDGAEHEINLTHVGSSADIDINQISGTCGQGISTCNGIITLDIDSEIFSLTK